MKYYFKDKDTPTESFISTITEESLIFVYDKWDDYGHRVTFYAFHYNIETSTEITLLGQVKIASPFDDKPKFFPGTEYLRASGDYKETYSYLEANDLLNTPLPELQESFYFLGDEDFYTKLKSITQKDSYKLILRQLGDLALNDSKYTLEKIQNENVVINSFFRDTTIESIKVYQNIINQADRRMPFSWNIKFKNSRVPGAEALNDIELTNDPKSLLPTNIFALVGNNGVGKTTLLKDIATAAIEHRSILSNFMPGIPLSFERNMNNTVEINQQHFDTITRALFITFSSFDYFDDNFLSMLTSHTNIKFLSNRSYDTDLFDKPSSLATPSVQDIELKDLAINSLISTDELVSRMRSPLLDILRSKSKKERLLKALDEFSWDSNFSNIKNIIAVFDLDSSINENSSIKIPKQLIDYLSKGSSGQKIILSMLIQIVSYAFDNSLVLIDEPELYLHPPYVLALVLAIERILTETNSIGIITTHSAVVLQEIPSKNVFTIKEIDNVKKIGHPTIETFGANSGTINNDLFNLDIRATGYYKILSKIVDTSTEEQIDKLINNNEYGGEATMLLAVLRNRKNVQ